MRFTTLCGGLCQAAFMAQFTILNLTSRIHRCPQNRMSEARPQHQELHAQCPILVVTVHFSFFLPLVLLNCKIYMLNYKRYEIVNKEKPRARMPI